MCTTRTAGSTRIHRTLALAGTAMLFGGAALAAAAPAQAAGAVLDPVQVERSCKTPGKSGSPEKAYYSSVVLRGSATGSSTFTFDSLTVQNNPALTQITPKQVTVPAGSTTTVTIQVTGAKNSANGPAVLRSTVNQGGTTSQHTGTITSFAPMQTADCGVTYPSNVNKPWPVTNQQVVAVDFYGNQAAVPAAAQGGVSSLMEGRITSYALKTDGSVVAWKPTGPVTLPAGWTNLKSVDSSDTEGVPYQVAVTNAGTALVDGLANSDQLAAATNLKSVATAREAAMGLTNAGTLIPAGYDYWTGAPAQAPAGLTDIVQLVSAYDNFVALKADGTIVVFSAGGQTEDALSGVFTSVAASHVSGVELVALKADGAAVYWTYGNAPVVVATDATHIAIGADNITGGGDSAVTHVYVQHRDGTVDDTTFEAGGGQRPTIPVPALKGATSIVANNTGVVGLLPTA